MTVKDLLQLKEFSNFELLAGEDGLDREIDSVNIIDSPDSHSYFHGGELLLTNTYIMRDDPKILIEFTRACSAIGSAAIGIKLGRYLEQLPDAFFEMANDLRVPIIALPVEIPFEQIIKTVYTEIVNSQTESKYRDEFIQSLLLNSLTDKEQIKIQEERFGWELSDEMIVVVVGNNQDSWHHNNQELDRFIIKRLRARFSDMIYTGLGTCLIFIFKKSSPERKRAVSKLAQFLQEMASIMHNDYDICLYIGISSFAKDALHLAESYSDARLSERMARRMNRTVVRIDELRTYQILSKVSKEDHAQALIKSYLGCIKEYDDQYQTDYFKTLRVLAENDWNLKRVSETMFIHYNTVKYRYTKIGELIGEDLHSNETKFNIALALRLYEIQNLA